MYQCQTNCNNVALHRADNFWNMHLICKPVWKQFIQSSQLYVCMVACTWKIEYLRRVLTHTVPYRRSRHNLGLRLTMVDKFAAIPFCLLSSASFCAFSSGSLAVQLFHGAEVSNKVYVFHYLQRRFSNIFPSAGRFASRRTKWIQKSYKKTRDI